MQMMSRCLDHKITHTTVSRYYQPINQSDGYEVVHA